MKVSKREVKIFVIGFFTCMILEGVCDWKGSVEAFKSGWNSARANTPNKTS